MSGQNLSIREKALVQIRSENSHERYLGARTLVKTGLPEDLNVLMVVRKAESDAYARKWMELAIAGCAKRAAAAAQIKFHEGDDLIETAARERIRSQAIEWVAGALIHEIGSKIGLLAGAARREVPSYEISDTARYVGNLERVFEGIVELRKAAAPPRVREFDLAELIEQIVAVECPADDVEISLVGRKPLLLLGDPDLLRLALCNGIRNAVEAVRSVNQEHDHQIVVVWEITDKEFWISVIDHGPGVVGAIDSAFEIGRTNKAGHAGFGLAIAKQAMEKFNGSVALSPSVGGGATYEIKGALIL